MTKKCFRCGLEKPREAFHRHSKRPSGCASSCKACIRADRGQKERIMEPVGDARTCNTCRITKPRSEFYASRGERHGIIGRCKACHRIQRGVSGPPRRVVDGKKLCPGCRIVKPVEDYSPRSDRPLEPRSRCRECVNAFNKIGGVGMWRHKITRYGISASDFARMVAAQGGHCGLCGGDPSERGLVIDHDHETGKVRALLCNQCNVGLGNLQDSEERLQLAIAYLRRHRAEAKV